jgi:hypothetical protein
MSTTKPGTLVAATGEDVRAGSRSMFVTADGKNGC